MPFKGTVGATCDQHVELHFSWKVEDFFSLSAEVDDFYNSPDFHFLGHSFRLRLYPSGSSYHKSDGCIGLFVKPTESYPPMEVEYTFGIQTQEGKIEKWGEFTYRFESFRPGSGTPKCLKKSDLLIQRQELAPSDAVTFTVTMKTNGPRSIAGTTDAAEESSSEDKCCDGKRPLEKTVPEDISTFDAMDL